MAVRDFEIAQLMSSWVSFLPCREPTNQQCAGFGQGRCAQQDEARRSAPSTYGPIPYLVCFLAVRSYTHGTAALNNIQLQLAETKKKKKGAEYVGYQRHRETDDHVVRGQDWGCMIADCPRHAMRCHAMHEKHSQNKLSKSPVRRSFQAFIPPWHLWSCVSFHPPPPGHPPPLRNKRAPLPAMPLGLLTQY
jgi:hypothetical protein